MVPKGWVAGKVCDVINGLEAGVSVNGDDRSLLAEEKAVLKVSAVSYGRFDPTAAKAIQSDELDRAKTNPRAGRIIISRSNTDELVGASAYIMKDYNHLFLSDKLWQTLPKQNVNMEWLSYVLASSHSRFVLSSLATGTSGSMKNITKGELLGLKILIPPYEEQRKIAQILSTWDKAITTTERLLTNRQQQKKALMQRLLTGKQRFAGFEEDWKKQQIKDVVSMNYGKSPKDILDSEGIYPVIGTGGITGRSNEFLVNENAVIVGRKGTIDRPTLVKESFWAIDTVFYCLPENGIDITWFYYWISHIDLKQYNESSGLPSLSRETIYAIKLLVPDLVEQQKIASVLSAADAEITAIQNQLDNLKQQKKALMQQLLTGKRRVKVDSPALATQ